METRSSTDFVPLTRRSPLALVLTASFYLLAAMHSRADVVVPIASAAVEDGGLSTPLRSAPRTFQEYIDPTQFASITTPTLLTGIEFRLYAASEDNTASTWPSQNLTFTQYSVQLSQASTAAATAGGISTDTTFAANEGGPVSTVRSGALTIPAGSFINNANSTATNPNPYGFDITFAAGYLYTPGQSLVLTITESGYAQAETQEYFGSVADPIAHVGSLVYADDNTSTSPSMSTGPIFLNFTTNAIPEPSTWALLLAGVGAGTLVMRHRAHRLPA